MRPIIIVMAIIFSLNAQGRDAQTRFLGPQQVNALPSVPPDHRIRHGLDAEQFGELRLPRGMSGRVPMIVPTDSQGAAAGFVRSLDRRSRLRVSRPSSRDPATPVANNNDNATILLLNRHPAA
jgi:hypothetical protein